MRDDGNAAKDGVVGVVVTDGEGGVAVLGVFVALFVLVVAVAVVAVAASLSDGMWNHEAPNSNGI